MTLFVVNSNAQRIVEKLPDNSYIVEIEGVEYRALPPDSMRKILKTKEELKQALEENIFIKKSYADYRLASEDVIAKTIKLYETKLDKSEYNVSFYKKQFEEEKKLREKYAGNLGKCTGKVIFFRICTF